MTVQPKKEIMLTKPNSTDKYNRYVVKHELEQRRLTPPNSVNTKGLEEKTKQEV